MFSTGIIVRDKAADETEISSPLKLATTQAGEKSYGEAVSSLRRAYSLMQFVATEYQIATCFRLARYLHLSGDYEAAIQWLQGLYDSLDDRYNAREALYEHWGWMQSENKPVRTSKTLRNNVKKMFKREIEVFSDRQLNIKSRLQKSSLASSQNRLTWRPTGHRVGTAATISCRPGAGELRC